MMFKNLKSLWQKVAENGAFEQSVDLPWDQENEGAEPVRRQASRPFVNHDMPLASAMSDIQARLDELQQLAPIKPVKRQ